MTRICVAQTPDAKIKNKLNANVASPTPPQKRFNSLKETINYSVVDLIVIDEDLKVGDNVHRAPF